MTWGMGIAVAALTLGWLGYAILDDSGSPVSGGSLSGQRSLTRSAGSAPLGDSAAAAMVRRAAWEPRPQNTAANQRVPTSAELATFRATTTAPYHGTVTGNFTGTTDEIIQWAAWKWGIDEDLLRAQAIVESTWDQASIGDNGQSFGLFQVKSTVFLGTAPLSRHSTAFNADYYGAQLRYCLDGHATWLNTVEHGQPYTAGDIWGCVGQWYAGRWHTPTATTYINTVKATLKQRRWQRAGF